MKTLSHNIKPEVTVTVTVTVTLTLLLNQSFALILKNIILTSLSFHPEDEDEVPRF
jgi:hypothetical protein